MFLDIEIYLDHADRVYYPGDTVTCKIDVQSMFRINCKHVRARIRCPFRSKEVEYFRVYEIAKKRIAKPHTDQCRIGEKAENVVLQRGRNQFLVSCKIPDVSYTTFEQYSNLIRCSLKVTVKANWFFKRNCIDWFALEPRTTTEEVINKVENGASRVFSSIGNKFRGAMSALK